MQSFAYARALTRKCSNADSQMQHSEVLDSKNAQIIKAVKECQVFTTLRSCFPC